MFNELDPLLHSQLRLAIIALLMNFKDANFVFIKEKTNATDGNLSVQINKLKEAGYIRVKRTIKGNFPETVCRITPKGVRAFEQYVKDLDAYLSIGRRSGT
jgi:DNA-binding MarR family transcriptional regulator